MGLLSETSPALFLQYAERARSQVDGALATCLLERPGCPARLREAMEYALLAPGKRLRPILVLMAAEACSSPPEPALPAACAVEMIHAYSLVHDDLPAMDDDALRRGRPTCHRVFGEAMAVLAGDALLALAFETLATLDAPPEVTVACLAALARAAGACQLVGGQADDVDPLRSPAGLAELEAIHRRKTGAMIGVSLELGARVAGADVPRRAALESYGQALGLAFQITDDLLDVEGNPQTLGKEVRKDADHGKLTFPGLLGIEPSRLRARQLIAEAVDALAPLGPPAAPLESLAHYVLERNR